jgi:hypothetical protein
VLVTVTDLIRVSIPGTPGIETRRKSTWRKVDRSRRHHLLIDVGCRVEDDDVCGWAGCAV